MSFKGLGEDMSVDMAVDLSLAPDDPDFMEEDIMRSIVNGMSVIDFFERIQQILVKDMVTTVVVKLLGCIKDLCPTAVAVLDRTIEIEAAPMSMPTGERTMEMAKAFRPLSLLRENLYKPRENRNRKAKVLVNESVGSRFNALSSLGKREADNGVASADLSTVNF
ncbi:hypothetical protein Goshw_002468 [Gossypium schwendimanii]|uniref:Uncharacterized protein n=1 Tax=Gossypium schwendimanii TaxID=34291 RepID=A0A7J9L0V9_GOSSC|nr:hypothetical protein [Gossypium schwendimanii]